MDGSRSAPVTAKTLAAWIDGEVRGEPAVAIRDGAALANATADDLVYVAAAKHLPVFLSSASCVAIAPRSLGPALPCPAGKTFVLVDDPQTAFVRVLERLRGARPRPTIGVSPNAFVSPTATIGRGTNVHPAAHVGDDVVVGENCDIHPGAYLGPGCRLGNDVVVHPYAVLYADVVVGNRVTIHATAVLGADGFGYRLVNGRHERIPHLGHVRIEDDVEIGASTTIDRGMIGATVVGEGTKLDNLVMIAHNCELGRHNVIVAQVGFAGSVTTGDYVVCAGHVGVADHVHLGAGCVLGSKAGVNKDIPPGETWIGQPAQPVQEAMKGIMSIKKLPEIRKHLKSLESRLAALERERGEDARAARANL